MGLSPLKQTLLDSTKIKTAAGMKAQDVNSPADCGRPLCGQRVIVTRPLRQGWENAPEEGERHSHDDPLANRLRQLGAEVIVQPAIRIMPPPDWRLVDDALARLADFDWLVFSSTNGVMSVMERLRQRGLSPQRFPRLAAIGPGTAEALAGYGLQADLVPKSYRAEALAEALASDAAGRRFLLARASRGREVLAERLAAAGADVRQIVVYTSADVGQPDADVLALLRAGKVHWITVTSSTIARWLIRMFGDDLRRAKLASISPLTSGVLAELGHPPHAEAAEYTLAGLAAAICLRVAETAK
jgi:uroporphyrinogen III methyltransferase/synthase